MAISPFISNLLFGPMGLPGTNVGTPPYFPGQPGSGPQAPPVQPQQQPQGFFNKADQFLQRPGGNFLMNLLAQDGYSTMPGSPLGAVGRAGVMTQQQGMEQQQFGQQQQMAEFQKKLIEAKIGRETKLAETGEDLIGKISPDKYTPESLAKFQQTRSHSDLVPRTDQAAATPSQVAEYEYYNSLPTQAEKDEYLKVKRGEPGPSSTLENRLFAVNDNAFKSRSNVSRYENLAQQMLQEDPAGGTFANWTEKAKAITGNEDEVTLLRKNWNELRVSSAIQNLPPGVASDKDIELVMSAFLPEFANAETVSSFLRGLAKLENIKAGYHEFESDYLSERGTSVGLQKAWRERLESSAPSASMPDISSMSDEELQRLANGG